MRVVLFGFLVAMSSTYALTAVKASDITSSDKQVTPILETSATGQVIYEKYCIVCHQDGLVGAPKFQKTTDWTPKLANKTIDELVKSAVSGLNAMPAKGSCSECSTDDIKEAINYMLPTS
jgi:cytochrome c5